MTEKEFKYQRIERRVREIIAEYDIKLTIRQVYYRLVSSQDLINKRSQYVYYDDIITKARKEDLTLAEYFEDKTRKIVSDIDSYQLDSFSDSINSRINAVKKGYPYYFPDSNLLQKNITVILLEKQALETIFENALGHSSILVTARGFNSFTQLNELRKLIENDKRELHLYTFTDYDDSGLFIEENFINQMKEFLNVEFDTIERIALTEELIEKYNIPQNPTKTSTHSKYNLPYFVELDALEPDVLTSMIKGVCSRNYDKNLHYAIDKAFRVRNRRLKKAYFRELRKVDLSNL